MARTRSETPSSKSAKILYQPIGIVSSLIGGLVAGQVFKQVWKHATPGDQEDAPKALESEYQLKDVLIAAIFQGAIFAVVKASIQRGGARAFQRWTGEWPGD
ncbi:MAG: DUF4235 domain-containing protein [Nocardioidaceae bacterium]